METVSAIILKDALLIDYLYMVPLVYNFKSGFWTPLKEIKRFCSKQAWTILFPLFLQ